MIKIVTIFAVIVGAILMVAMALTPLSDSPTTRFESLFTATTADSVVVTVRLLGSYHTNVWPDEHEFLVIFQEEVREEIRSFNHADIPKKLRLVFQKTLIELESAGAKIDSVYQYIEDDD